MAHIHTLADLNKEKKNKSNKGEYIKVSRDEESGEDTESSFQVNVN